MMNNQNTVEVVAIIITHNASKWIYECLLSVSASITPVLPIIVDNNSSDSTIEIVQSFQEAVCIQLSRNIGFGKANNIGITYALNQGCKYVFLLNQDARIDADTIYNLIKHAVDDTFGILSPVHLNKTGDAIDTLFVNHLSNYGGKDFFSDLYLGRPIQPIYPVDFLNAAAWLITREFLVSVGGFDPLFFMYAEDDDLCDRARIHKYKVGLVPSARAYHYREKSGESARSRTIISFSQWNRIYSQMVLRLKRTTHPLAIEFARITIQALLTIMIAVVKLRIETIYLFVRAYLHLVSELPEIAKNRKLSRTRGAHWI